MRAFVIAVRRVQSWFSGDDESEPPARVVEMTDNARGETVTAARLSGQNDRSARPLYEYLDDSEQPEFVLSGMQVIFDDGDDYETKYPTRETQVLVTDRRILVVLGGQFGDDSWQVGFDDVLDVYVDDESVKTYFVLDAVREDEPMTFFVDVTANDHGVREAVSYVREQAE
jgi:hypothetical protein